MSDDFAKVRAAFMLKADASMFARVGAAQLAWRNREGLSGEDGQLLALEMLARCLNLGRVVGFLGSGVSAAYGHHSWACLSSILLEATCHDIPGEEEALARYRNSANYLDVLDACRAAYRRKGSEYAFFSKVAQLTTSRGTAPAADLDPLAIMMRSLRIHRFLTINYDAEIEKGFVRSFDCPLGPLGLESSETNLWVTPEYDKLRPSELLGAGAEVDKFNSNPALTPLARSLTFDPQQREALLQFAVGAPGYEYGVYHCHGVPQRPDSLVITERDYQRLYLSDDPARRSFREAFSLTFAANPVLFLGVGMSEDDLLRPLREFVSSQNHSSHPRHIFALLRSEGSQEDESRRRQLQVRFGVSALFYDSPGGDWTKAFCDTLNAVRIFWADWWMSWQKKPPVRAPAFSTLQGGKLMVRYPDHSALKRVNEKSATLNRVEALLKRHPAILVLGHSGTGKGTLGLQLAHRAVTEKQFNQAFFASTHFTNDLHSTLEAAARHFGAPKKGDAIQRLSKCLTRKKVFLVVGGIERLMMAAPTWKLKASSSRPDGPGGSLEVGQVAGDEVVRLFEMVSSLPARCTSRVVLTSSVEPVSDQNRFKMKYLWALPTDSRTVAQLFPMLDAKERKGLHRLLRGHAYALILLAKHPELTAMRTRLSLVGLTRRPEMVAEAAVEQFIQSSEVLIPRRVILATLQHLAIYSTPVSAKEIVAGFPPSGGITGEIINQLLAMLEGSALVLKIGDHDQYTVHTLMRQTLLRRFGTRIGEVPGELTRLALTTFSTETTVPPVPPPRTRTSEAMVSNLVDNLLTDLETRIRAGNGSLELRSECRAAFGAIRSRWTANSIPQTLRIDDTGQLQHMPHYDSFQRRLLRLLEIVRRLGKSQLWSFPLGGANNEFSEEAILYPDELGWLYSELAMISYTQGSAFDAYALFRMGEHVNALTENDTKGMRWRQSHLSLAGVHLDRANFPKARLHLDNALLEARSKHDPRMEARVLGYLGLLLHLSGSYHDAEKCYTKSVGMLRKQGNRRGLSIFSRNLADLIRLHGRARDAEVRENLRDSTATAESGGHLDLVEFARVADCHRRALLGEDVSPEVLDPTLAFARRLGTPKLEADALKVQGIIALQRRDTELASRLGHRLLGIVTLMGLELRRTAALVFMGKIASAKGEVAGARSILLSAFQLAQRQGYQLQAELADRELVQLG